MSTGKKKFNFERSFEERTRAIGILFMIMALVIVGRVLWLQFDQGQRLKARAERQYNQRKAIKSRRGTIEDRKGRLLAVSLPLNSAFAVPAQASQNAYDTADILSSLFGLDAEKLAARLAGDESFIWIKRNLDPKLSEQLRMLNLDGVDFLKEYQRYYPGLNLASQLLGFTGADSKGLEGLEYKYNQHLMDSSFTNEAWLPFGEGASLSSFSGGSLRLTLDALLQHYVEEELEQAVTAMQAKFGTAILMESQTGKILSMATFPDFNPNRFSDYNERIYYNKAIGHSYEPGSTFKVVTLASALELGSINEEDYFHCENGQYQIGDRKIHDIQPHGYLSLEKIIQYSSNICAAKIALSMPRDQFHQKIMEFGFGSKTGIDLSGEARGTLHDHKDWSDITLATLAYGHSVSATPIQVISAINAIATGGEWVEPRVVETLYDGDEKALPLPQGERRRILSERVAKLMQGYMKAVVTAQGTGRMARIEGLEVAAKTGTSRKFDASLGAYSDKLHTSSFVGFFPADQPKLTLMVVIDEPQERYENSKSAAVVFKRIVERIRPYISLEDELAKQKSPQSLQESSLFGQTPSTENENQSGQKAEQNGEPKAPLQPRIDRKTFLADPQGALKGKSLREALWLTQSLNVTLSPRGSGLITQVNRLGKGHFELILTTP